MHHQTRSKISRKNGSQSKGPITPEGKAISRANSTKHGFTATVLTLATEDPQIIDIHVGAFFESHEPKTAIESDLTMQAATQSIRIARMLRPARRAPKQTLWS